jgi:hypothetical protein
LVPSAAAQIVMSLQIRSAWALVAPRYVVACEWHFE